MEDKVVHPSELLEFAILPASARHDYERTLKFNDTAGTSTHSVRGESIITENDYPSRGLQRLESWLSGFPTISTAALTANQAEHRMKFRAALRIYPKAIAWAGMISLAIIMEGYDTALVTSLYAFNEFQQQYGIPDQNGQSQITTKWQASLSNGSTVGSIIGLFANGIVTEVIGYRRTMLGALILLGIFVFLPFFAFNIQTLLAGQFLCGLPWGVFSTLSTTYAAEVMPLSLRGYLTSNINLCWLLGQFAALGILRGLAGVRSTWSFRIPFGLQWAWILIIIVPTCFAPESPWWLVRHGRKEQAKKVLMRLRRATSDRELDNTIAMMEHTDRVEKYSSAKIERSKPSRFSDTSYAACFRGSNLRRTEIACMIFMTQNMCGLPIIGYAAYLYKQMGFDERRSFDITLGMQGLGILGAFVSLALLKYVGRRRTLYLTGLGLLFVTLIAAGVVSCLRESRTTLWVTAALMLLVIFIFDSTVGPVTYCLVAELPSNRLRVKTVVLARVAYNINSIVTNVLIQRMLNPSAWNWRGKACFFCALLNCLCFVYCFFRLPETRGFNFHELDILFEKGADARKFATFQGILERSGYYSLIEEDSA
ncbi:uncharacterized protein A1O9_06669 [Exophiala aquamarina CBS 119918]|uniref:Major facilitator superfamily (MFS) profile domain-containing protein n=1 Tax=Exophiala aquamarina CBS 119918 TaxID=1182545 RepID=A0A072PHG7_9EURO|nr:uncharacterized protein A1O9_06669 [Exophiala aquamarina CBS 119918]KEF58743.1 hypothetical protein A1O9_06669 [Exophiala aquamarina CBS 119918]